MVERFRREAEAIAGLRHPHIVPIFSVAEEGSLAWFVMPRVRGESLAHAIEREGRWGFAEIVRILREGASALAAAHATGIVHRDIKPENIMLEGGERRVVLMDFGIAKSVGAKAGLTATGLMVGTPQYMSPEQAAGDAKVDHLSDQYALALVGYHLLTGQPAFQAESPQVMLVKQMTQPAQPVRELRPDAPVALARIIERALEKDPAQRFNDMSAFGAALDKLAREVAGEFRRGRRTIPAAERWVEAIRQTREIAKPAIAAAVAGAVVFVVAYPFATSPGLHQALGTRDEALVLARAELAAQGARNVRVTSTEFRSAGDVYRFLHRAVGRDSAERLASGPFDVWGWGFRFESPPPLDYWYVNLNAENRVSWAFKYVPDSLLRGGLSTDSALAAATAAFGRDGVDTRRLRLDHIDSTFYSTHKTYGIRWSDTATAVVRGGDTAVVAIGARVLGPFLTSRSFGGTLRGPTAATREAALIGLRNLVIVIPLVFALLAIVSAVRRSASDDLQWAMAARAMAPIPVAGFATFAVIELVGVRSLENIVSTAAQYLSLLMSVWLISTVCVVAGESRSYETQPHLTAGLGDVTRGRFRVPELLPATLLGYGVGLGLAGATALGLAVLHQFGAVPFATILPLPPVFSHPLPSLAGLAVAVFALPDAAMVLFALGLFARYRIGVILASTVSAGLVFGLLVTDFGSWEALIYATAAGCIVPLTVRQGILATTFALVTMPLVQLAAACLRAGGPFTSAGVVAIALLAVPPFWAWRLWLRRDALTSGA